MSKLKLKRIKEQDNCGETSQENMNINSNPVSLKTNLNMQHLFGDKSPLENTDTNCPSSVNNIEVRDEKTSKYFITSSLPDVGDQFDESEVEFQSEKRPRRKAVTPQKEVKKKSKPLRRKIQKDIRHVMNPKNDDLLKYTQQFERECTAGGVDVNPEHLQLAIALSRSLSDFQKSDNANVVMDQGSPIETELTPSQETAIAKKRIISIRKTLDEFGFKVQRTSDNAVVKLNVGKKRVKRLYNYPLLLKTQTEKSQRITDCVTQMLFQSVPNNLHNSKHRDNIPSGVCLNKIWCESSCIFAKSRHAYEDIKDNSVYYPSNLMTRSIAKVGCLLRDWGSIPGREKSPERHNEQSLDFRESEIYLNSFDVLLSGTCSMITARATKGNKKNSPNSSFSQVNRSQNIDLSNSKFIKEVHDDTRCSSPDLFGDDSYCEGNIFLANDRKLETVNVISTIVVNDSSDDELPRVYFSKSQNEFGSALPNISEGCVGEVNTLDHHENTFMGVTEHQTPEESFDLTLDESENSLSNQNHPISVIKRRPDSQMEELKDDKKVVDVSDILENSDSICNTSGNINLSEVYEGRNGIIHYESFQTSPVSSMSIKNSNNLFDKFDSSSNSSDEDMFESTRVRNISLNLDSRNACNTKSVVEPQDSSYFFEIGQNSPPGIDLTQSSKDSNISPSPSFTTESKEINKHVSCQSMLIANRISFEMNNTESMNVSSAKSESDQLQCTSIIQNSPKDIDLTIFPNDDGANLSVDYSLNCGTDNEQASCLNKLQSSIMKTPNISSSSMGKSMNELSTGSSACGDIFVVSDEEFNYSMSTPYNKDEKSLRKNIIKKVNCKNVNNHKNITAFLSKIESDELNKSDDFVFEEKEFGEIRPVITRKSITITTDNKTCRSAYNLDLGGSSIFDRIPSCNSSFLGNYITRNSIENKGNDTSIKNTNYSTPCTSKNVLSDFTDDNNKQACKNLRSGDEILSDVVLDNRISAIGSVTPNHSEYLIETNNVTPAQDFNELDTPKILKELSRFGLKPLKRKRAVQLLEHIYNETHPVMPLKLPPKKRRRLKDKNDSSSSSTSELKSDVETSVKEMNPEHTINDHLSEFDHGQIDTAERSHESYENNEDIENNSDIYLPDSKAITIKQIKCDPDDWIFQNREKAKIHGCRVPLHIAFHNYLSVRSKLKDAILCYEPVNIDTIHRGLISEGYKYNTKDLFHFMDKNCITIKTTDKNVAAKRHKKR